MNDEVLPHEHRFMFRRIPVVDFSCTSCETRWSLHQFNALVTRHRFTYLHCPVCGIRQRVAEELLHV